MIISDTHRDAQPFSMPSHRDQGHSAELRLWEGGREHSDSHRVSQPSSHGSSLSFQHTGWDESQTVRSHTGIRDTLGLPAGTGLERGSGPSPVTALTLRDLLVTQLHCPQKHRATTLLFAGKPKPQWPPAGFWCWFMGQDRPCGCAVTAGTSPWAGRAGRWELGVPTRAISV